MERVGRLLGSLEGNDPLRRRMAEVQALDSWPELVGPHLAKLTRPLRVAGGRLFVIAHGSALRQELVFQRREILGRFNRVAGRKVARELVLLESDANLSSLVEAESAAEDADRRSREYEARSAATAPGASGEETEDHVPLAGMRVVPAFDAAAYRREMNRIADETRGEPHRTGPSASPEEWEKA